MLAKLDKRLIALLAILISATVITSSIYIYRGLYSPVMHETPDSNDGGLSVVEVVEGSSLSRITSELHSSGYIRSPQLFKLLAKIRGVENTIRAGEYEIEANISAAQLLTKLVEGETIQYRVTLVEGWTFQQALDAIWNSKNITASLNSLSLEQISERMILDQANPEGLLYPDTYFYTKNTSDLELLTRAKRKLDTVLNSAWETRSVGLPYNSPYEVLIMASIIEKESADNTERSHIAAVFLNRLERGMRLQSDPTVIYGMGDRFTGNISREDLSEKTSYNTYRINGLPPTPIALSGMESIRAALEPSISDYLYFVAKGNGRHQFSRTLEEHNTAVQEYQLGLTN